MSSRSVRPPISIIPAVIRYDNALKVRFRLFIAGIIFSSIVVFCCPVLIMIQINGAGRADPTATSNRIAYTTATKSTSSTPTKRSIAPTVAPHVTRTATSQPNPIAKISCADKLYKVNLRRTPGYKNKNDSIDSIFEIPCDEYVELLGDTKSVDGLTWWKIRWNELTGWVADHTASGKTILIFDP